MTLAEPVRLNDAELTEIGRRMVSPITDEGLRAWYRHDVEALVAEVLALRRERAAAVLALRAHPVLRGLDPTMSLGEMVQQLMALWSDEQRTVRRRMRRT